MTEEAFSLKFVFASATSIGLAFISGGPLAQAQQSAASRRGDNPAKVCAAALPVSCRQRVGAGTIAAGEMEDD